MIPIGSLDRITSVVGERGTGKSTFAVLDARQFQRETGGLVVGHSPNGQLGHYPDVSYYDSVARMLRGIRKSPARMHFLATGGSPEDVLYNIALPLSTAIRKNAVRRQHGWFKWNAHRPAPRPTYAPPILAVIDEGTHLSKGMTSEDKSELEQFLTSARHFHIAVSMLIQAPTARSWTFQEQSSRFRIFRYMHEWGSNSMRAAGIPKDMIARIAHLEKFVYYRFDKSNPDSNSFVRLPLP